MTNLEYCRYYKGEEKCPPGDYETFERFWYLEREYFTTVFDEPSSYWDKQYKRGAEFWETEGVKSCEEYKDFLNKFDKITQGFLAYAVIIPSTHCPQDTRYILNYGKK